MEAHTRQCRTPQLAPVVCQLTTQSGYARKGGILPHRYHATYQSMGSKHYWTVFGILWFSMERRMNMRSIDT